MAIRPYNVEAMYDPMVASSSRTTGGRIRPLPDRANPLISKMVNDENGFYSDFSSYNPGDQLPSYFSVTSSGGMGWNGSQFVSIPTNYPEFWTGFGVASFAAGTNLALRSSDLSNAAWTTSSVSKSASVSCIQSGVAQKITLSAVDGSVAQNIGAFSGGAETAYVIIEQGNTPFSEVLIYNNTTPATVARVRITYATGAISLTGGSALSVDAVKLSDSGPNGGKLYICSVTFSSAAGNVRRLVMYPAGNGLGSPGDFVYAHHAQLCTGTRILPPIVTGAATASRGASSITITQPNMPSLAVNPAALTYGVNIRLIQPSDTAQEALVISDGTANNRFIGRMGATSAQQFLRVIGGVVGTTTSSASTGLSGVLKMARSEAAGSQLSSFGGVSGTARTDAGMPTGITQVNFGHFLGGTLLNGFIQQPYLYPVTSAQADLNARTAP